jgi:hypothetical protein
MFLGRLALAKVVDANLGRDDETCNVFTAKLQLFEKASTANPSTLDLKEITNQTFEIVNTNHSPLSVGEQIIVAQGPDERWFTLQKPHPKFQFVTTGKIVDRAVQVKVLRTMNAPPDLSNQGEVLEYKDTLTVYDPFNLWSDIEAGATGWAHLAYQQVDDTSTTDIDEQHVIRYEIEECSLPVNEVSATLRDCLMGGMSTGVALVDIDNQAIRSAYPNVDHPPEIPEPSEGASTTEVELTFENLHKLDGIAGSRCILRRITNLQTSDPENYTAPTPRSSTTAHWEIVKVSHKIARHVRVAYASGFGWATQEYYDGYDPDFLTQGGSGCEITVNCPLCECPGLREEIGDNGYAFLDTTASTIQYYVYSTKSSFYPNPKAHKILAVTTDSSEPLLNMSPGECEIDYKYVNAKLLCYDDPLPETMTIPTQDTEVADCGTLSLIECGSCVWTYQRDSAGCTGSCDYTFQGGAWVQTGSDCSEGCDCGNPPAIPDPLPAENTTTSVDCTQLQWVKTQSCGDASCTECAEPGASEFPQNPTEGQTYSVDCSGAGTTNGSDALCLTVTRKTIKHIDCGSPVTASPCQQSCVGVEECVEP